MMLSRFERMAADYARDELGWPEVEVYGTQRDPKVYECCAVWLHLGAADGTPVGKIGLIVHLSDGVLEEFDPELDGEPGQLGSGEPRLF